MMRTRLGAGFIDDMDNVVKQARREAARAVSQRPPTPTIRTPHALRDALRALQQCPPDADPQQVEACLDRVVDALDERIADSLHLLIEADATVRGPLGRLLRPPAGSGFFLLTGLGGVLTSIAVAAHPSRLALVWASVAAVNLIWAGMSGSAQRRTSQAQL
jgi:hypothetical protein